MNQMTDAVAPDTEATGPAEHGHRWIKNLRVVFAVVMIALGIFLIISSEGLGYLDRTGAPGPGFFPRWVGLILAVLAFFWGISEMRASVDSQESQDLERRGWLRAGRFLVAMVLFAILLVPLGYVLTSLAFMLYLTFTVGRNRGTWWINVIVSLAASVGVYLVFVRVLGVVLPSSPFIFMDVLGL